MVLDLINLINNSNSRKITPLRTHQWQFILYKVFKLYFKNLFKTHIVFSMLKFENFKFNTKFY